jgi:hypothetical protein
VRIHISGIRGLARQEILESLHRELPVREIPKRSEPFREFGDLDTRRSGVKSRRNCERRIRERTRTVHQGGHMASGQGFGEISERMWVAKVGAKSR